MATPALSLITMNLTVNDISQAYPDLTPEEQQVLLNIRKRKEELLQEIYQLKEELSDVNTEIEAMDTEEGAKMKSLQMGKKKFNMDPKKGVEYLISHDLTDLIVVQALRQFLWSFRLPGEAQKIDRMMESFAQRYCQLNPDIFTNSDTCYVLSFA